MVAILVTLALIFVELSLLSFGGGITILPEMQRQVVDVHHWMTAQQFSADYALAQSAPGPNMMVVSLIGWHIGGWLGVLVATLATFGPTSILTIIAFQLWQRFKDRPWRRIVQAGLVPITAGFVISSAAVIAEASATTVVLAGVTATCATLNLTTRIHPLILLGCGAIVGLIGAVG